MNARILSLILSSLILVFIIESVRREKLTFKYAAGWILVTVGGMLCAVFDQWLARLSAFLGFELVSNFIFFAALNGFVLLSLILTVFLCQQNERNDKIAQKLGILEFEVNELKKDGPQSDKK